MMVLKDILKSQMYVLIWPVVCLSGIIVSIVRQDI